MWETLTHSLLEKVLHEYVEQHEDTKQSVWSGYITLENLQLQPKNKSLLSLVSGSIQRVQITIPWHQLHKQSKVTVVVDGLCALLELQTDPGVSKKEAVAKRRKKLNSEDDDAGTSETRSWKTSLLQKLKEGLWVQLLKRVEIHVRNAHIRLEHQDADFASGIVFEGLHLQPADNASALHQFGVYWNATSSDPAVDPVHRAYRRLPQQECIGLLSQTIPQRSDMESQPRHTYIVAPLDAHLTLDVSENLPATAAILVELPVVTVSFRDFQLYQGIQLYRQIDNLRHCAKYWSIRPDVSVFEDPKAWWRYACQAAQRAMKKRNFSSSFRHRCKYMELYEKKLLEEGTLTDAENQLLSAYEDGTEGDMSVEDVRLFRFVVQRRRSPSQSKRRRAWLLRTLSSIVASDEIAHREYEQLMASMQSNDAGEYKVGEIVLAFQLRVKTGNLHLFSPLALTSRETELRRLHERFVEFTYKGFSANTRLLGDLETYKSAVELVSFSCIESRTPSHQVAVIQLCDPSQLGPLDHDTNAEGFADEATPLPLLSCKFTKNPKVHPVCDLDCRFTLRKLHAFLEPDCSWLARLRSLLRPLPDYQKASNYWKELTLASINSWASQRVGWLAKMNAADRKRLDLEFVVECPLVSIRGSDIELLVDFGEARLETVKLAGISDASLPQGDSRRGAKGRSGSVGSTNNTSFFASNESLFGDSVRFDQSIRFDEVDSPWDDFAALTVVRHDEDAVFYDEFDISLCAGGIRLVEGGKISHLCSGPSVSTTLQTSILPEDHTLPKVKVDTRLGEFSLLVSPVIIEQLVSLASVWKRATSSQSFSGGPLDLPPSIQPMRSSFVGSNGVHDFKLEMIHEEVSSTDDIDEDEFFDTMENASLESDAASLFETDARSRSRSFRSRSRRQPSIVSELSSVSEGSVEQHRVELFDSTRYLSAENLARLEEEALDEERLMRLNEASDSEPFRSAVSATAVSDVLNDIQSEFTRLGLRAESLRNALRSARNPEDDRDQTTIALQLARCVIEMKSLSAAREDLLACNGTHEPTALAAAKNALAAARQKSSLDSKLGHSHTLVSGLRRQVIHFCLECSSASVEIEGLDQRSIVLSTRGISFAFQQGIKEKRYILCLQSLVLWLAENGARESLFAGGCSEDLGRQPLPVLFPHLLSGIGMELPFLQLKFESFPVSCSKLRVGIPSERLRKVRALVGDVELGDFSKGLRLAQLVKVPANRSERAPRKKLFSFDGFVDVLVQSTSWRLPLYHDARVVAILALSDLGVHAATSRELSRGERLQLQVKIGSLQAIHVMGPDLEAAIEVLGKGDPYSPFMRCRIRLGNSTTHDQAWVAGVVGAVAPTGFTENHGGLSCHAGLWFGSMSLKMYTRLLEDILPALRRDEVAATAPPKHRIGLETSTAADELVIRCRVDVCSQPSAINVFENVTCESDEDVEAERRLELTFTLRGAFVPSLSDHRLHVAGELSNLAVVDVRNDGRLLVLDRLECSALFSSHSLPAFVAPLEVASSYDWNVSKLRIALDEERRDDHFTVSISKFQLLVVSPSLEAVLSLSNRFRSAVKNRAKTVDTRSTTSTSSNRIHRIWELTVDKVSIDLCSDTRERLVSWIMRDTHVSLTRGADLIDSLLTVRECFLNDCGYPEPISIMVLSSTSSKSDECIRATASATSRDNGRLAVKVGEIGLFVLPSSFVNLIKWSSGIRSVLEDTKKERSATKPSPDATGIPYLDTIDALSVSLYTEEIELVIPCDRVPTSLQKLSRSPVQAIKLISKLSLMLKGSGGSVPVQTKALLPEDRARLPSLFFKELTKKSSERMVKLEGAVELSETHASSTSIQLSTFASRNVFQVVTPANGEQRIVNPFDLSLNHSVMSVSGGDEFARWSHAHSVRLDCSSIDALVYVRSSSGGLADAHHYTLQPIIDSVSKSKRSEKNSEAPSRSVPAFLRAPLVLDANFSGVKLTFVPGGATQFTEASIAKVECEFLRLSAASCLLKESGVVSSPRNMNAYSSDSIHPTSSPRNLHFACTVRARLSASYQNHRLIAWEPFVEPWELELQVGVSASEVFDLEPFVEGPQVLQLEDSAGVAETPTRKGRLRDIGRLLRSPFRGEHRSGTAAPAQGQHNRDFVMICLLCFFDHSDSTAIANVKKASTYPLASEGLRWLELFGHPNMGPGAMQVLLRDASEMRINVSGALIELALMLSKMRASGGTPHLLRNLTGREIIFTQALDTQRVKAGERAPRVSVAGGQELPLALRRNISRSSCLHAAHIIVEVGHRRNPDAPLLLQELRLDYRLLDRVGVDTVGCRSYDFEVNPSFSLPSSLLNKNGRGVVQVRTTLTSGTKIVSVESTLFTANASDRHLLIEIRDTRGITVWRKLLLAVANTKSEIGDELIAVPVDLVQGLIEGSLVMGSIVLTEDLLDLSDKVEFPDRAFLAPLPVPGSPADAAARLDQSAFEEAREVIVKGSRDGSERSCYLNVCFIEISSRIRRYRGSRQNGEASPAQWALVIRSPYIFSNRLPHPVLLDTRLPQESTKTGYSDEQWSEIGLVPCGESLTWSGAGPQDSVDLRFRLVDAHGGELRQFPSWSSSLLILPKSFVRAERSSVPRKIGTMRLRDAQDGTIDLTVHIEHTKALDRHMKASSVEELLSSLSGGRHHVILSARNWIIDGTGLGLHFKSWSLLAGQIAPSAFDLPEMVAESSVQGLAELLDDGDASSMTASLPFRVVMMGEESYMSLQVGQSSDSKEPLWSETFSLRADRGQFVANISRDSVSSSSRAANERVALAYRCLRAPSEFGGTLGTKLVYVVCRYGVVNELGRDLEMAVNTVDGVSHFVVRAGNRLVPLYTENPDRVAFRPREYGWDWSGRFSVDAVDTSFCLQLRHKLKAASIMAGIDIYDSKTKDTTIIVIRPAQPPYRIENNTLMPLRFSQLSRPFHARKTHSLEETIILPLHKVEFAWDEPESGPHAVVLERVDLDDLENSAWGILGRFDLDSITPGQSFPLSSGLNAFVSTDGPTRVLEIREKATALEHVDREADGSKQRAHTPFLLSTSFRNGIGISLVDWHPRELLFFKASGLECRLENDSRKESFRISIEQISLDNQMWVTSHPVLFRMGAMKAREAVEIAASRRLEYTDSLSRLSVFETVDVKMAPSYLNVDGELVQYLIQLIQQSSRVATAGSGPAATNVPRDERLMKQLGSVHFFGDETGEKSPGKSIERKALVTNLLYEMSDFFSTTAVAAKLRSRYLAVQNQPSASFSHSSLTSTAYLLKRKYYVERLRVSSISGEVSWSGTLPIPQSLLRYINFGLTFEGLPLSFRSMSLSHFFGTSDDYARLFKAHYLGVPRIMDLMIGLANPGFIIKTSILTGRNIAAKLLQNMASRVLNEERTLPNDQYVNSERLRRRSPDALHSMLHRISFALLEASRVIQYDPSKRKARHRTRLRNPRLFAKINDQDLLVEYQEGESAGKALLSRVSGGAHVSDDYLTHAEGCRVADREEIIILVTQQNMLLVNGERDQHFCDVLLEVPLRSIMLVEIAEAPSDAPSLVTVGYIGDKQLELRRNILGASQSTVASGMTALLSVEIHVPSEVEPLVAALTPTVLRPRS